MRFTFYGNNKPTKRELEPYFIHFTRHQNLPLIAQYKALLSNKPDGFITGCTTGTGSVYAYNVQLATESQNWETLPLDVILKPDDFVALFFRSTPDIWWCYEEECQTAYNPDTDSSYDVLLHDYEVITVTEAFDLMNVSIDQVIESKKVSTRG